MLSWWGTGVGTSPGGRIGAEVARGVRSGRSVGLAEVNGVAVAGARVAGGGGVSVSNNNSKPGRPTATSVPVGVGCAAGGVSVRAGSSGGGPPWGVGVVMIGVKGVGRGGVRVAGTEAGVDSAATAAADLPSGTGWRVGHGVGCARGTAVPAGVGALITTSFGST